MFDPNAGKDLPKIKYLFTKDLLWLREDPSHKGKYEVGVTQQYREKHYIDDPRDPMSVAIDNNVELPLFEILYNEEDFTKLFTV